MRHLLHGPQVDPILQEAAEKYPQPKGVGILNGLEDLRTLTFFDTTWVNIIVATWAIGRRSWNFSKVFSPPTILGYCISIYIKIYIDISMLMRYWQWILWIDIHDIWYIHIHIIHAIHVKANAQKNCENAEMTMDTWIKTLQCGTQRCAVWICPVGHHRFQPKGMLVWFICFFVIFC